MWWGGGGYCDIICCGMVGVCDSMMWYMDVLNEYFEVVSSDVYYTVNGNGKACLKGGAKNRLYGKTVNLSKLYSEIMDDVVVYIQSDTFLKNQPIISNLDTYVCDKYGVTLAWIHNKIYNLDMRRCILSDEVFSEMIKHTGGIDCVNWLKIYNSMQFITKNVDILVYIGNQILKNDIYKYFVDRYNLTVELVEKVKDKNNKTTTYITIKWQVNNVINRRRLFLSDLKTGKRDWWKSKTANGSLKRLDIRNYDIFLNGRDENEVLPDVCPIDSNIVLNYTGIDFSGRGDNRDECRRNTHNNIVWSPASIDRIDGNKPYSYDNVEIISSYYNTQVKNCASFEQISKLYHYQLKQRQLLGIS